MFNLPRRYLLFAGLTLIVFLLFFISLISRQPKALPILTGSNPVESATDVSVYDPLFLEFDLPVIADSLLLTSEPAESWQIAQLDPNTISLSHALALSPSTKYSLTLTLDNSPLATLSFTTQAAQGDPRLVQTLEEELSRDYPLAELVPYETASYRVIYTAPMELEITLKSYTLTKEDAISQIKSWVKKNGGDPTTHQYLVISLPPTPTPTSIPEEEDLFLE